METVGNTVTGTGTKKYNDYNGIHIENSNFNLVTNNTVTDAGWDGIKAHNSSNTEISDNIILDSNRSGASLFQSPSSVLYQNTIKGILSGFGFWVVDSSYASITENTIDGTFLDGMYIKDSDHVTIHYNDIGLNALIGRHGIQLVTSSDYDLLGNTIINVAGLPVVVTP